MGPARLAALAGTLAWLSVVACTGPGVAAAPEPARIVLQNGDLPAEIGRCPGSGAIDGYLRELGRRNPGARDELRMAWADLKRRGAVSAAVAVYTARAVACDARLGAGDGPSTTSLVVAFQSEEAAAGAYRQGMLSFTTPGADEEVDGLVQGAATGLGRSAWIVQRQVNGRATLVAYWQRHTVAAMVIAVDEDPLHARQALTAVDGRIP